MKLEEIKKLELDPNKAYMLVFDRSSGLNIADAESLDEALYRLGFHAIQLVRVEDVNGVKVIETPKK